jgi:DNA repair photolyase
MNVRQPAPESDGEPRERAPNQSVKGRGATFNPQNRYDAWTRVRDEEEGNGEAAADRRPATVVTLHTAKSLISRNQSPDLSFTQSLNPYMGCEHGCVYCYARPAHAYLGLSPGLDFETQLFAKPNAAEVLRRELAAPGYVCDPIMIGGNTDPYQPIEREHRITRAVIEVLSACEHPFSIITKNALIERDIDLMAPMAGRQLVQALVSVTNWDAELARKLEPRASAPWRRIEAIRRLSEAGIPTGVMVAPVIPLITDRHMEEILERAREAGATSAGYVMLRLPNEVAPLFKDWLAAHYPLKEKHVLSLIHQMRGGRDYDSRWGLRQRGTGEYAAMIGKRFAVACRRLGLNAGRRPLSTALFKRPGVQQLNLF